MEEWIKMGKISDVGKKDESRNHHGKELDDPFT
jgi:hypothetical protein